MFILSAGLPKSGSTLLSLYQREILVRSLPGNGQLAFEEMISDGTVAGIALFVHDLEKPATLNLLEQISLKTGPFLVKTHAPLNQDIREMLNSGRIMATYIHRDPRDIILSAIDHGRRPADHPAWNPFFARCTDIGTTIPIVRELCHEGAGWMQDARWPVFTYTSLLTDPAGVLGNFFRMLGLPPDLSLINELVDTYVGNAVKGKKQFNTGKISRFREEMTTAEVERCTAGLAEEIRFFGYTP